MRASGHVWGSGKPSKKRQKLHPQVVQGLSWSQRALLQVDLDTELLAKPKEKIPRPYKILERGPEDKPVVEVPQYPKLVTMNNQRNRGHDVSDRLWSCRKAEAKRVKLEDLFPDAKPRVTVRLWKDRNLKVSVSQV